MTDPATPDPDEEHDGVIEAGVWLPDVTKMPWRDLIAPDTALRHSVERRDRRASGQTQEPVSAFANFALPEDPL